jgi:hypothetical protein
MSWLITGSLKSAEGVVGVPWDQIPDNLKWSPSLITTALWLDAADASTVDESGGAISEWRDKSGNGYHCGQSTAGEKPTYSTNTLNGKAVVTFDNDHLNNSSISLGLINRSIFAVFAETTAVGNAGVLCLKPASALRYDFSGVDSFSFDTGTTDQLFTIAGSSLTNAGAPTYEPIINGTGATPVGIWSEVKTAGSGTLYQNGSSITTDSSFTEFSATNTTGYVLGRRYFTGAVNTASSGLRGYIAELIYASSTLSTLDRQKTEGYLAHKWGLTANLPSGHPYKVNVPTP